MGHLSRPDRADKRHDNAGIAQLVEHLICNQGVAGSNPAAGTRSSPSKTRDKCLNLAFFVGLCRIHAAQLFLATPRNMS